MAILGVLTDVVSPAAKLVSRWSRRGEGTWVDAPRVDLAPSAENNGLATMIVGLVQQNLADKPHKVKDFARLSGRVAIVAEDADVAMTLWFDRGRLTVHDGIVGIPDVTVRGSSDDVINMSLLELTPYGALPDFRGEHVKEMLKRSLGHGLKVYGALSNLPLVFRLMRVMSVQ